MKCYYKVNGKIKKEYKYNREDYDYDNYTEADDMRLYDSIKRQRLNLKNMNLKEDSRDMRINNFLTFIEELQNDDRH